MKPGVGLIGKKLGMTQLFLESGAPVAVTVLEAGPCSVVQVKSPQRDGYAAVQLGFGEANPRRLSKPAAGHCAKAKVTPKRVLREFRLAGEQLKAGDTVTAELFKAGDRVDVTGRSLGKGFQGGMARCNWSGGPKTHGSMSHRAPGSIGASATPSRVYRGHPLPGHMGDERVTVRALEVIRVDLERNLILVKGAVPGRDEGIVVIRRSTKPPKVRQEAAQSSKKEKGRKPEKGGKEKSEKAKKAGEEARAEKPAPAEKQQKQG